jgi:hypothetical protein
MSLRMISQERGIGFSFGIRKGSGFDTVEE